MDDESLAALAEGVPATRFQERHLAGCRVCASSYAEAVRFRVRVLAGVVSVGDATPRSSGLPGRRGRSFASNLVPTGLAFAITAVIVVLALRIPHAPEPPAEILALLQEASAQDLVLPGGQWVIPEALPIYRGPDGERTSDADARLIRWSRDLRAGEATRSEAVWLVGGLIAGGRLQDADAVLSTARARYPGDSDLTVLEAVLAWRTQRPDRARSLLSEVLVDHPGHSVARFNLGRLLLNTSRDGEGREHLARVVRQEQGRPLEKRAAALLD